MGDTGSGNGTVPDRELVGAARGGDRQALVAIYDRWADRLYNHCFYLRLRREDEARDLAQQTLVIVVRTLGQLREPERFASWLFAIAHQEAGRMPPARAAWDPTPDDADSEAEAAEADAAGLAATPAGMVMDAELRREVWRLVWRAAAGLAQVDRELLNLSHREGFRPSELGLITGLEPPVVRQRLARVQEQLERALGALLVARLAGQGGGDHEGGRPPGEQLTEQLGAPCGQLAALLSRWDGRFTGEIRQGVSRHLDRCETCTARRLLVTPEALLPPPVPVPWHVRDRILARLQLAATGVAVPSRPAAPPAWPNRRPRHGRHAARGWPTPPPLASGPAAGPAGSVPPVAATRAAAAPPAAPRPAGPARQRRLLRWLRDHAKALVLAVLLVLFVWLGGWLALRGQPSPFTPERGAGSQAPGGRSDAQGSSAEVLRFQPQQVTNW